MFKQKRLTVFSMALLLAMLFAAVVPMSALADDGVPPTDVPAAEVPVVDVPVADAPVVDAPMTVPEILDAVPADTDVVVLDESGDVLPLASAAAADVILDSDPMWCPASATTVTADCVNDATVTGLLVKIVNKITALGAQTDGTIYFAPSYTANDVTFDGTSLLSDFQSAALTIQGGWAVNTTLAAPIVFSGNTMFTNPVVIKNWGGDVTLNNIAINGASTVEDNALYVDTTGDVVLNHVDASFNSVDSDKTSTVGAGGAAINTTGDVTVNNSTFNYNTNTGHPGESYGLSITSDKKVTLNNVKANYNNGDGVDIYENATGPTSVTVSNSTFNNNYSNSNSYGDGLWVDNAQGDVSINNVTASFNTKNGVTVVKTTGNIFVNGGQFTYNGQDGLNLTADQNITMNGVTTYGNRDDGAELCAGQDVNINGGDYYWNNYGTYIRCGTNVNSYYGNWWGNYYWGNYWYPYWGGYYYGYYGNYWNGWAMPIGGNITLHNIYVDGNFMPTYGTYAYYYNTYYNFNRYDSFYNNYYYYGRSGYWYWRWHRYQAPVVKTTTPMTVDTAPLTEANLPAPLPKDKTFADAFKATVSAGAPGEVAKASFDVPANLAADQTVTVLSWDGTAWTEVPSEIVDGKVVIKVGASGTFALATP